MRARPVPSPARLLVAALLSAAGAACGGDAPTAPSLARLDLVATPDSAVENESATWRVSGVSNRNAPIETGPVTWASSDTTVAVVSSAGTISARLPGQALVTATAGTASAQATFRVTPGRVVSLTFVAATDSLPLRSEGRFSVQPLDALGRALRGRTAAWRATDTTIAVIAPDGRVTPRAVGRTQIVATIDAAQATYELVVREPLAARVSFTRQLDSVFVGQTDSVVAVLLDSAGVPLKTVRPRYASSDASIATVDLTGRVRGLGAGKATITASGDGQTRSYVVSVVRAPIDHIFLPADTLSLFPGTSVALGASVRDLFGVRVTDREPTWVVSASDVVGVDASGLVSARRTGTAVVSATVEKATTQVVVHVVEPTANFQPEVRFVGPTPAPLVEQQIREAMARWQTLVVGDLPDITISRAGRSCGYPDDGNPTFVDDLLVVVEVDSIDGPGNVLGAAGPCLVRSRTTAGGLTAIGVVTLDSVDVSRLASQGLLVATMQHEMGHILGLGTLWTGYFPLSTGIGGADPRMTGFRSRMASSTIGATLDLGVGVPLENTGGEGTRDGHWRESVFGDELMTGFIGRTSNPLSILSVQAMADLGYLVDVSRAEPFVLAAGIPLFGAPGTLPLLVEGTSPLAHLFASPTATGFRDVVLVPEFEADRGGVLRRIAPRAGTESRGAATWRANRRAAAAARAP